ncbi:MAG: NAD(P)H-dependent oxidoreductase [Rhodococcus sp.]|nr:NAD(P)H-dependent oxidoreductase [Rhodococcus sp. (in: high G+C Gram-positive bacteria)]
MQLILISGSTRQASTNTAVLRSVQQMAPTGTVLELYTELAALPAFDPDADRDPLPEAVDRLRKAVASADGVLFCTPEYAGALPGSVKNLLDWLVGDVVLTDMPVAWINVSSVAAPTGGAGAHGELRTVLGYVQAGIVEEACRRVPMARTDVNDGVVTSPSLLAEFEQALRALSAAARRSAGE